MVLKVIGFFIVGYIVGSIPWALIIGQAFYHVDVRTGGSGNLGATNAGRVTGHGWVFVAVTILDALKGFAVYTIMSRFDGELALLSAFGVAVGHCYPVFAQFHGGKGVATTMGIVLAVSMSSWSYWLWQFALPVAVFAAIVLTTKYVSLGSLVAMGVAVAVAWVINPDRWVAVMLTALWLFVIYKHRSNIDRLVHHQENKVKI